MYDSSGIEGCTAIILGAGLSSRMGQPKLLLPWGKERVITRIVHVIQSVGIGRVLLVTGASHELLVQALAEQQVSPVFNPDFADGNMAHSLQWGIRNMPSETASVLLALGDQPQIQAKVIAQVLSAGDQHPERLILPSFQMRRGHPWLIPAALFQSILDLPEDCTMRDFIRAHESLIEYVCVDTASILADLDTPEDYLREKPREK